MLQKSNMEIVLEVFTNEPTKKHYLKEISEKSKLAHTSVKIQLIKLVKANLIIQVNEKKGKRNFPFFVANINSEKFKFVKKIQNLKQLYSSGILNFLEEKTIPSSIVLFGSYSNGEDIESSDIDIFIESKEIVLNLNKFEKKLNRKINIYFKSNINLCPKELRNNIANGMVLLGFIELK